MNRINPALTALWTVAAFLMGCSGGGANTSMANRAAAEDASTPSGSAQNGHLVIVGGGLKKDNADIHSRFIALCAEGPIGIIPIASGDGLAAGTSVAKDWREYAGEKRIIVIPLTKDSKNANGEDIAKQIASCGGLWFTGGDQSRVTAVLKPSGESTKALEACFAVLAKGGVIGGTSAGAAIMTDPMITGGQSPGRRTRESDETASPVRIGPGLGFLSIGLTDQHFLERGRMGRLITALHQNNIPIGFGIRENCALVIDRAHSTGEAMGNRAVCVLAPFSSPIAGIDSQAMLASLSVLSTGDTVSFGPDAIGSKHSAGADVLHQMSFDPNSIKPAPGMAHPPREPRPLSSEASATRRIPDPWDMAVVENALDRLEHNPAEITLQSDRASLEFSGLSSSRMFIDPTHARPACLINIWVSVRSAGANAPAQ